MRLDWQRRVSGAGERGLCRGQCQIRRSGTQSGSVARVTVPSRFGNVSPIPMCAMMGPSKTFFQLVDQAITCINEDFYVCIIRVANDVLVCPAAASDDPEGCSWPNLGSGGAELPPKDGMTRQPRGSQDRLCKIRQASVCKRWVTLLLVCSSRAWRA